MVALAAGAGQTMALKADGTVLAWGINLRGQLGDGTTTDRWSPVSVAGSGCVGVLNLGALTPAQMIGNLIEIVLATNAKNGTVISLINKLEDALKANTITIACNKLDNFIDLIKIDPSGGPITAGQASQLISAANLIRASLGCL